MLVRPEPAATGLRILYDRVQAAGGQLIDGIMQLPSCVGTGYIQLLAPEPGLRLAIHHCTLLQELTLKRVADDTQPETLLISCSSFGPTPADVIRHLSSVQITSSDIEFSTTLPAQTELFIVGISVHKSLLRTWLGPVDGPLLALLTTKHPVVVEGMLKPEIQRILSGLAQPGVTPYLPSFFYRIRIQELLYGVFKELAYRIPPARFMHPDDVAKIYKVRDKLLTALPVPPSLTRLAGEVGLSEPKLKQLFRQVFGTSPYAFYQFARMEEAKRLLQHLSVSEVGYRLGFTNLSHFARLFSKHHQLTPKKYQATLRL